MSRLASRSRLAAMWLLLLPLAPGLGARQWAHAEFALDQGRPERLVVLPPLSQIVRAKLTEAEPMIKETEAFEQHVVAHVTEDLRALGYTVDSELLSPPRLAEDGALAEQVVRVRERAEEALAQFHQAPKHIVTGRYSIGEVAAPLAAATRADGFLLLHAFSVIPSKGNKALAIIGGSYAPTITYLQAVLVDASSGIFQAVMAGETTGGILKDPDKVAASAVASAFAGYPRKGELGKVKRARKAQKRGAAIASTTEDLPEDEDRVLAEFEAIYAGRAAADASREVRDLFEAPAATRPEPTARFVFHASEGPSKATLRNGTSRTLRVSVDLAPWMPVEPGQELLLPLAPSSHSLLVADDAGSEVARGEWTVSGDAIEVAEILRVP